MNLVPFKHRHYKLLIDMLHSQACPWQQHVSYKTLPKIGYIALLHDQPIAVGFLRRVEGGYGQLDTFATNPYFGSQIRHQGIELVVEALLDEAQHLKLHGLICFTKDPGILARAKDRGFILLPDQLLAKN
jgi:hypothetical protein